ncbi:MAG: peptidoglycan editing factor PgeF [Pseudomonadota bacterium]
MTDWLKPDWPVPDWVGAISTTRSGGGSEGGYRWLNLGTRCGDDPDRVAANRRQLAGLSGVDHQWLRQVHGVAVHQGMGPLRDAEPEADAAWTDEAGIACTVLTADCLPVLVCDAAQRRVAAAHAGWRGLAAGVLEATFADMDARPESTRVWLGPAIGPQVYEVGEEVRDAFQGDLPANAGYFQATRPGHWLCNLPGLAAQRLRRAGFGLTFFSRACTFGEPARFYSYRRDGDATGRMASAIWIRG